MNNLVGRCMMEADLADGFMLLTMTYANSPEREIDLAHKLLLRRHFQTAVKNWRESFVVRKRRKGLSALGIDERDRVAVTGIRYLGAGEYGETYGRAHFHGLFFWTGRKPLGWWSDAARTDWHDTPYPEDGRRFWVPWWPHGHVHRKHLNDVKAAARYVAKYVVKDLWHDSTLRETWLTRSNRPILGDAGFREIGRSRVGLVPFPTQTGKYVPGRELGEYLYSAKGAALRAIYEGFMEASGIETFQEMKGLAPELLVPSCRKFEREARDKEYRALLRDEAARVELRQGFDEELRLRASWQERFSTERAEYARLVRMEETGMSSASRAGEVYNRTRGFVVPDGVERASFRDARGPPVGAAQRRRVLRAAAEGYVQYLKDAADKRARMARWADVSVVRPAKRVGHGGRIFRPDGVSGVWPPADADALGVCPSLERGLPVPAAL